MGILPAKENTSKPVRMPFTNTEEAALRTGVELHGTGAWAVILGSGRFAPTRTNVDLKDKWRNMATGIQKGAAEDKRLGRLDRKRPASALPPAADIRVAKAKRLPVDELVGLRPYLSDIHRLYQETEVYLLTSAAPSTCPAHRAALHTPSLTAAPSARPGPLPHQSSSARRPRV